MELKKTNTSIFLVPLFKITREKLLDNNFLNAYIADNRKEIQYENSIYLLFKPENIDKFKYFLDNEYERTKSIIDDYDYEDGFVVLVYELNKKFENDYKLIKQGKFSHTSKLFQEMFPKVIKIVKNGLHKDEVSLQYRIFNKTEDLREYWENKLAVNFKEEMEVWDGWDEEKEIMNLDRIKEMI